MGGPLARVDGWMRRPARLELILMLSDGSHLMVPAAWTDLRATTGPAEVGTVGPLDDLLSARRVLDPFCGPGEASGHHERRV
jgi:hypothetical protein